MSTERDVERIVRSWMDEVAPAFPDSVLDAVFDQVPATPQRRARWRAQRYFDMNKMVAIGLVAAAAILVVALIGLNLGPGSGPPPGGAPSGAPSATPTSVVVPTVPQGALEPGTYRMPLGMGSVAFEFTVPAGWTNDADAFVQKNLDAEQFIDVTTGAVFSAWIVDHVFADACAGERTEEPIDDTTEALVTALGSQDRAGGATEGPSAGEVADGDRYQRMTLSAPADLEACGGRLRTWPGLNGDLNSGWSAGPGQVDDVYVFDREGSPLIVVATYWEGTTDADRSELDAIVRSIRIP